jgi:hypothetical protein
MTVAYEHEHTHGQKKAETQGGERMKTFKLLLAVTVMTIPWVPLARAQRGGIEFGRVGITNFTGHADIVREVGRVRTYTGNVTITFPDAAVVLHADAVMIDDGSHEFVIQGPTRLTFDAK